MTSPWLTLAADVSARRRNVGKRDWRALVNAELRRLANAGKCDRWAALRPIRGASKEIRLETGTPIVLASSSALEDGARLALWLDLEPGGGVARYSIGLSGTSKRAQRPWYVRVDLDSEAMGMGPCSHAFLHCHVGEDPEESPPTRIPLPWLEPQQALAWVIASAFGDLEPRTSLAQLRTAVTSTSPSPGQKLIDQLDSLAGAAGKTPQAMQELEKSLRSAGHPVAADLVMVSIKSFDPTT